MNDNTVTHMVHEVDSIVADRAINGEAAATGALRETLLAYEQRYLLASPGYFILSGLTHLDEASTRRFVLVVSATLGEPMPDDFSGNLIREVRYRGVALEESATARYSDTRQGGNLHTDGMHRPGAIPIYFTLFCVRQAAVGGALVLVHIDDLVRELRQDPEVVKALCEPVHFDTRADDPRHPRTVLRPILEIGDQAPQIAYLREYVDSGHRQPGIPSLSTAQIHAMDQLDALLERADLQLHLQLEPGQMIVVNNRTIVHGRTPFEQRSNGENERLLLRTWVGTRHG